MNGLALAKQLRAIRPDLPVILVSGYSVAVDADHCGKRASASGRINQFHYQFSPK
jgi:hypothetical protein